MASGPLSVPLPDGLRKRLARHAKKNNLKLATAARALIQERLKELEDGTTLADAHRWQLEQVWGSWERMRAEKSTPHPPGTAVAMVEAAIARVRKRRARGAR